MDKEMRRDKLCTSLILFIFSTLLLTCCVSAQCGDCDDKNPCTRDLCDGTLCQHTPQSCNDANSSAFGKDADIDTAKRAESPIQNNPEPTVLLVPSDAIAASVSCDDNNPCTSDSYGANGCVHDPVNCDDGNASTTDLCGPSGCVNTPLPGESYSVEFLSPALPEMHNEIAEENTTINESQSAIEVAVANPTATPTAQPICDDGNPCTTDAYNGTGCVYELVNCDDGNDSTIDSCREGACINEPIKRASIILPSENNSTALSSSNNSTALYTNETLVARHPQSCDDHDLCTVDTLNGTRCEHKPKNCDDADPATFDYCFGGVCQHTTSNCDDSNNCTIDSFNGTACVHTPKNCDDQNACTIDTCVDGKCVHTSRSCDDGNPCTYDRCDPKRGCLNPSKCNDDNPCTVDYCDSAGRCRHSPVVCGRGKTCIDGVCQYPYYTYPALYYPYYPYYEPYVAPSSTLPSAQSYTIPVGTAITLPWTKSVTALNALKVENGIAYPGASPLKFVRSLGLEDQAVSGYQTGPSISERAEMIGLSWKDEGFTLTLIQPNGSILPVQGDNRNVMHLVGSNYDYYFLRSAAIGNWGLEVKPINPGANGVGFSLITGLVKGAAPINQP